MPSVFLKVIDGKTIEVTEAEFHANPTASFGIGDAIASVATPIARILGLSCIDPATKQLRPDSKCAQRRDTINRIGPKFTPKPKP